MKISQRGFIPPFLLALIAVLLVGGGAYVYINKQANQSVVNASMQATSTAQTESLPSEQLPTASHFLLNTNSNLTEYENALIKKMSAIGGPDNAYILKWYDDKTAVFIIAPPKGGGASMDIYDIKTLKRISTLNFLEFGIESSSYIIATGLVSAGPTDTVGEEDLIFYKKGATDFQVVPNSTLLVSETYSAGIGGMGSSIYHFTFDEPTKTLSTSVFKRFNGSASENTKIRTVKFVLP
jgi:hypothetical protein